MNREIKENSRKGLEELAEFINTKLIFILYKINIFRKLIMKLS
jgi:hypothetical protein